MRYFFILLALISTYLLRLNAVVKSLQVIPDGSKLKVVARISQQPYLKDPYQIISLGGFLIKTGRFPGYDYGQKVEVIGRLEKKMLGAFRWQFILNYPSIKIIEEKENLVNRIGIARILVNTRGQAERVFGRLLPEPHSSLLSGILLGSKRQMPDDFLNNLRNTGTMHVIVASGYNITVIASFFVSFLAGLVSRRKAIVLALLAIVSYTIMVGGEPAIVRAAIMGSLTYSAQFLGREKDAVFALLLAAVSMLLISPLMLFDIGFQLSFLATAGILFIYPLFKGRVFKLPLFGEELKVTLAAQIGTLPILLANFGQVSFLSPFVNALVLPVVPLIMTIGAIVGLIGFIFLPLAWLFALIAWAPLSYFVGLVNLFGSSSFSLITVGQISFWWAMGYYIVIALWILKNRKFSSQD